MCSVVRRQAARRAGEYAEDCRAAHRRAALALAASSGELALLGSDGPQTRRLDPLGEVGDRRPDEPGEVRVLQAHGVRVRTGLEDDRLVFGQGGIDVDRHAVQVAERGHRAELAIGEQRAELPLLGEPNLRHAEHSRQLAQVHAVGRPQGQHHRLAVGHDHDDFDHHPAGDVLAGGDLLRGEGDGMVLGLEGHSLLPQGGLQALLASHGATSWNAPSVPHRPNTVKMGPDRLAGAEISLAASSRWRGTVGKPFRRPSMLLRLASVMVGGHALAEKYMITRSQGLYLGSLTFVRSQ